MESEGRRAGVDDKDDRCLIEEYLECHRYPDRHSEEDLCQKETGVNGGQSVTPLKPSISTVAVTIREQDGHHCMDVRAYPGLAAAQAALADELREKDGFWEKGELEGLDDEKVISEYANRVGDNEYVWVGPVVVEGLADEAPLDGKAQTVGATLDNTKSSNTKSRVLVFVEEGVAHDWVSDENVDVLVFDKDNLDAGDDFEIPERFEDLAPQWLKDLLVERDDDRPGMA
jgi:hypothetical protein